MDTFKIWENQIEQLCLAYKKIGCENVAFSKQPPATMAEIEKLEKKIKCTIPISLKETLLNFSKKIMFDAQLPDDFELPSDLEEIFSAEFLISLSEIESAEDSRKSWVEGSFMNIEDDYDKVWHDKLGFMKVSNGDVIAFDLKDENEDKRVVYLSHDGSESHGMILGKNFKEYFSNLILIGACGLEDWQVKPFIDGETGINPNCKNAEEYRKLINLVW